MNKYIVLSLCVSLSAVLCEYLNGEEGDECEWEGLKGRCVKESRCLTTLDDDSPKHPVCSRNRGEKIICCTDCNLVSNTKNAVFIPPSGLFWKNGQKARDNCLQYLQDLPYKCKEDGYYAGITRELDEDNRCYGYSEWDVGSSSSGDKKSRAEYPYKVLLGGSKDGSTFWGSGGFIISDKYIVTSASAASPWVILQKVMVGVSNHWDPTSWQTHLIKRFIPHPEFVADDGQHPLQIFNDIALIETETPIKFNENVLPACLHVEEDASVKDAITAPWLWQCQKVADFTDHITTVGQTIKLKECGANLTGYNYDHRTRLFFDIEIDKRDPSECLLVERDSVMITTQFSSCVHTAIGVFRGFFAKKPGSCLYFTKVSHYVHWIESIVWPDEP